ncbi:hypothetical protein QBC34DRAFT_401395 [Podospora aff. communis PSN243]|uniref:Uncharacterized protein n=1 Tax=Podospora aff. communis PSN243 TaxID=3040156 RepID=A0AAV9GT02_9PEZI|nr:hypothetical protein QBC34DRAFT_401395 [Podospora aff. communis PSN243]
MADHNAGEIPDCIRSRRGMILGMIAAKLGPLTYQKENECLDKAADVAFANLHNRRFRRVSFPYWEYCLDMELWALFVNKKSLFPFAWMKGKENGGEDDWRFAGEPSSKYKSMLESRDQAKSKESGNKFSFYIDESTRGDVGNVGRLLNKITINRETYGSVSAWDVKASRCLKKARKIGSLLASYDDSEKPDAPVEVELTEKDKAVIAYRKERARKVKAPANLGRDGSASPRKRPANQSAPRGRSPDRGYYNRNTGSHENFDSGRNRRNSRSRSPRSRRPERPSYARLQSPLRRSDDRDDRMTIGHSRASDGSARPSRHNRGCSRIF